jgi:hypothetical protein
MIARALREPRSYVGAVSADERDRDHMRRIGAYKAESHREAETRHLALSLSERLAKSWQLYLEGRSAAALDRRHDDPSPFYAKARALGLYRP